MTMGNGGGPAPVEPGMLWRPSPVISMVVTTGLPNEPKLALHFETVLGMFIVPFTVDQMLELAKGMTSAATAARTGLVLPDSAHRPPPEESPPT